jgi:hypothetical protein
VTSAQSGTCGPYDYPAITRSNGYTTYVANNMWACGSTTPGSPGAPCGKQTLTAFDPGNWSVTSNQRAGNTAVLTYPDVQQVFTLTSDIDPAISAFASITSDFTENMYATSGTIAQAAYDIWLSRTSGPNEIMIWVDNANRGSGGATRIGSGTFNGQSWTLYRYGGGELIWSLDANEQAGTVNILAMLKDLQGRGLVSSGAGIGQVDFGWEICSTGGVPEKFTVSRFTLSSSCAAGQTCTG